jgi:uncharacterized protein YjbJ (UPF0337 family)
MRPAAVKKKEQLGGSPGRDLITGTTGGPTYRRSNPVNTQDRRNAMKSSTKDQAEGKFHNVKGKLREVAGKLSDNPELEAEGKVEKIAGKVQEKVGQVKKVLGK